MDSADEQDVENPGGMANGANGTNGAHGANGTHGTNGQHPTPEGSLVSFLVIFIHEILDRTMRFS